MHVACCLGYRNIHASCLDCFVHVYPGTSGPALRSSCLSSFVQLCGGYYRSNYSHYYSYTWFFWIIDKCPDSQLSNRLLAIDSNQTWGMGYIFPFFFFPLHISYFVSQLLLRTSSKWGVKFACCMIPWCDLYLVFIKVVDDSIDSHVPWINHEPPCTLLYDTHSTSTIPTLHAVCKRPTFHPSLCRSGIRQRSLSWWLVVAPWLTGRL